MVSKAAIDQLPSLPQVLVQILDEIHSHGADYQSIAEIIRHDASVATRLISVANSSYYSRGKNCESIERALLLLGTDAVKTIAITASIKQFFSHFNQQHTQFLQSFWRRSLVSANFAQVLATLTSYSAPDEAYLCGLLSDVGQLILLTNYEQDYLNMLSDVTGDSALTAAEQALFGHQHCQVGADLIDSWNLDGFMADAVRYHHEPDHLVQDAHHLVKIVNLANQLSAPGEINDQALASADHLFGLNETLTRELRSRIDTDVDGLANGLNIDIGSSDDDHQYNARQLLGQRLGELGQLAQLNSSLWQAQNQESLQQAAQRSLFLTLEISGSVLFLLDDTDSQLCSQSHIEAHEKASEPEFQLPLQAGRSLISDAFLDSEEKSSQHSEQPLSVIDRQMLRYCGSDILVCWPLLTTASSAEQETRVGVLVFAINEQQIPALEQRKNLASNLCTEIANAIASSKQRFEAINRDGPSAEEYHLQIREAVHEASNPLSIIRNYLEMLRIKLGDDHTANEGLNLIKEEIDRVGNILLRLKDPQQEATPGTTLDINNVIRSTAHIFEDSICATRKLALKLELDEQLAPIEGNPEHLKQILTNLIKNAVEALQPGGTITVGSESSISLSGRDFAGISIKDDGPGIPNDIKRHLFKPVSSTKGQGHSGLGLSIVKKLVDDMDGSIVCRSKESTGAQFEILLPQQQP